MVYAVATLEPNGPAVLVREHPPAVDLLLVDPTITMEGLADELRHHWSVLRKNRHSSEGSDVGQHWPLQQDHCYRENEYDDHKDYSDES